MKKLLLIALCLSANCFSYSIDDLQVDKNVLIIMEDILDRADKKFPNDFESQLKYIQSERKAAVLIWQFYLDNDETKDRIKKGVDE